MDYGRCLQRMVGLLLGHLALGQVMQFPINQGHELVERALVSVGPSVKQLRYIISAGRGPLIQGRV